MPADRRLTGCAASDHPDPAVALGEVVGHLQNALAGSPQFALVLLDEKIGSLLSTIASVVHRLLGPDLLLALAGPHVAGSEHLGPTRASVVVWALCGVDVAAMEVGPDGQNADDSMTTALSTNREQDGAVAVEFRTGPDAPRPMFITGDGRRWRPSAPKIVFPSGSATVVKGRGQREVGAMMKVTAARGRTLNRLDHVPARAVLFDQLETTDPFIGGPSPEFPPLRAIVSRPSDFEEHHRRTVDIVDVDPVEGSIELAAEVEVGDRIQLVAYDRVAAANDVVGRLLGSTKPGDYGVLLDGDLPTADADELGPIATAAVHSTPSRAVAHPPWAEVCAVLVHALDED